MSKLTGCVQRKQTDRQTHSQTGSKISIFIIISSIIIIMSIIMNIVIIMKATITIIITNAFHPLFIACALECLARIGKHTDVYFEILT